jgi:hypothetical protein
MHRYGLTRRENCRRLPLPCLSLRLLLYSSPGVMMSTAYLHPIDSIAPRKRERPPKDVQDGSAQLELQQISGDATIAPDVRNVEV